MFPNGRARAQISVRELKKYTLRLFTASAKITRAKIYFSPV
jgi:hypothetical protein